MLATHGLARLRGAQGQAHFGRAVALVFYRCVDADFIPGIQQGIGAMGVFVVICGLVVGLLLIAPQTIGDFLVQIAGVFVQFFMDILSKVFGVTMG